MPQETRIRFAVGKPVGFRSSVWTIKIKEYENRSPEVYVYSERFSKDSHFSFHPSGEHHWKTNKNVNFRYIKDPDFADKKLLRWEMLKLFEEPFLLVFRVYIPISQTSLFSKAPKKSNEIIWIDDQSIGNFHEIRIAYSTDDCFSEFSDELQERLLADHRFRNGGGISAFHLKSEMTKEIVQNLEELHGAFVGKSAEIPVFPMIVGAFEDGSKCVYELRKTDGVPSNVERI